MSEEFNVTVLGTGLKEFIHSGLLFADALKVSAGRGGEIGITGGGTGSFGDGGVGRVRDGSTDSVAGGSSAAHGDRGEAVCGVRGIRSTILGVDSHICAHLCSTNDATYPGCSTWSC